MLFKRYRVLKVLFAAYFIIACGIAALNPPRISTSLIDLIPESRLSKIVSEYTAKRVNVLISAPTEETAKVKAEWFYSRLAETGLVTNLTVDLNAVTAQYKKAYAVLLSGKTRDLLSAGSYDVVLDNAEIALSLPFNSSVLPFLEDPFGLLRSFIMELPAQGNFTLQDGVMYTEYQSKPFAYIPLKISSDAGDPAALDKVMERILLVKKEVETEGVSVHLSGAPVHTWYTSMETMKRINFIGILSSVFVILVIWFLFKSKGVFIPIFLNMAFSFLGAFLALCLIFQEFHIITLVFGTSIVGVVDDYSIHYFAESQKKGFKKTLFFALLTSALSFSALLLFDFGALRQMAVFTIAGLFFAYAFAMLFYPDREYPIRARIPLPRVGAGAKIIVAVLAGIGLCFFEFNDGLDVLYKAPPELAAEERLFAAVSGQTSSAFLVVEGKDIEELLQKEENLPNLTGVKLSDFIPSRVRQESNYRLVSELYGAKGGVFAEKIKLKKGFATPQKTVLEAGSLELSPLIESLSFSDGTSVYGIIAISSLPNESTQDYIVVRPAEDMALALKNYRRQIGKGLLIGISIAYIALMIIYGRRGVGFFLPSCLAAVSLFGIFGWLGIPVNFVHFLALAVVIGLGLDYSLFAKEVAGNARVAVAASCLTSVAAFGFLLFSNFELIKSLGLTLSAGLLLTYFFAMPREASSGGRGELGAGRWRLTMLWIIYKYLPIWVLRVIVALIVAFIYPFAGKARNASEQFLVRIGRKRSSFKHILSFAYALLDRFDIGYLKKQRYSLEYVGDYEELFSRIEAKRGCFLICSHLGNIEVLNGLLPQNVTTAVMHAFMQVDDTPIFRGFFEKYSRPNQTRIHPVNDIWLGTAGMMKDFLDKGDLVMMAGDRAGAPSSPKEKVEFLGFGASFPTGVFRFAKVMETPIFAVFCIKTSGSAYTLFVYKLEGDKPNLGFVEHLERLVKRYPLQWYNFFDFWR